MWQMVRGLRDSGVTIILTTHYIEEAEEMADRIGVISKGELIVVEDKAVLMRKLGKKQLTLQLQSRLEPHPGRARAAIRWSSAPTASRWSSPSTPQSDTGIAAAAASGWASSASTSRTCTPAKARSRRSSSAW